MPKSVLIQYLDQTTKSCSSKVFVKLKEICKTIICISHSRDTIPTPMPDHVQKYYASFSFHAVSVHPAMMGRLPGGTKYVEL